MSLDSIINNKVGYLIALAAKERQSVDSIGQFDFIVDMFDRDDADDLGEYWSNTEGFAIRNGVCISNSSTALVNSLVAKYLISTTQNRVSIGSGNVVFHSFPVFSKEYFSYFGSGEKTNRHKAKLTSNVFNLKIKVNVEQIIGDIALSNQPSLNIFGKDAKTKLNTNFTLHHQETVEVPDADYTVSVPDYGLNASAIASGGEFGGNGIAASYVIGSTGLNIKTEPFFNIQQGNSASDSDTSSGGRSITITSSTSGISRKMSPEYNVGDNYILTTVDANNDYSLYVNDNLIYSYNTSFIVERAFVGIGFAEINNLSILHTYGKAIGIKSFKAWIDGMPEPPDESGFGVFNKDNIDFYYRDKYHQRIKDADTGEVIGFDYDPLA